MRQWAGPEGPATHAGVAPCLVSTSKLVSWISLPPQPMLHLPATTLPGCTPPWKAPWQTGSERPVSWPPITALAGTEGPASHARVAPLLVSTSKLVSWISLPPQPMLHLPATTLPGCTPPWCAPWQTGSVRPASWPPITAAPGTAGPPVQPSLLPATVGLKVPEGTVVVEAVCVPPLLPPALALWPPAPPGPKYALHFG